MLLQMLPPETKSQPLALGAPASRPARGLPGCGSIPGGRHSIGALPITPSSTTTKNLATRSPSTTSASIAIR